MINDGDYINAVRQYNLYMFAISLIVIMPLWLSYALTDFTQNIATLTASLTLKNIIMASVAGIMIQGLAMILFNSSIRFIQAKTIAKISYTEIFWVTILGLFIYNQHLYFLQIIGMTIILLVAYIGIRKS